MIYSYQNDDNSKCFSLIKNFKNDFIFSNLCISSKNLKDVSVLSNYPYSEIIDLSFNDIESIESFENSAVLKEINLSNNALVEFPSSQDFPSLNKLKLSNNVMQVCPTFSQMVYLKELELSGNFIENLDGITNCRFLRNLDLSNNRLTVTSLFGTHPNVLRALGIPDVCIRFDITLPTPPPLYLLQNLRVLNLSRNEGLGDILACELPNGGGSILPSALVELSLAGCSVVKLNAIVCLHNLESLDLRDNQILDKQEIRYLKRLIVLEKLWILGNRLTDYRAFTVVELPQLTYLDDELISSSEQVHAEERLTPKPEVVACNDHRINLFHMLMQPQLIRKSTLSQPGMSYPLLVLTGPPGTGMERLQRRLVEEYSDYLSPLVCHSTGKPGVGQVNGKSYWFIDEDGFNDLRTRGAFIATYSSLGSRYGMSYTALDKVAESGLTGVLSCEIEGMLSLKKANLDVLSILVLPQKSRLYEKRLSRECGLDAMCMDNTGHVFGSQLDKRKRLVQEAVSRVTNVYDYYLDRQPDLFYFVLRLGDDDADENEKFLLLKETVFELFKPHQDEDGHED